MPKETKEKKEISERPPIVVIMGHVDHGKSTLLDYIRKTNVVEKESGGITQHMYSYEIEHESKEGKSSRITFLDTPGHAAFTLMRTRGAAVADIAILVVAADDSVKAQTIEALKTIKEASIPYIVAINKIDLPNANVLKVKQDLSGHEVFLEGYGGDVPNVEISAKVGTGVSDLLELLLLVSELEELTGDGGIPAEGVVIESHRDPKVGISATLLIHSGVMKKGMHVVAGATMAPVRRILDFKGDEVVEATFSSPVTITGFNDVPQVGSSFRTFASKKEAGASVIIQEKEKGALKPNKTTEDHTSVPVIVKADTKGTLEAVVSEIGKLETDLVSLNILDHSVGVISEGDIKRAAGAENLIILGFNVGVDKTSAQLAEQRGVVIQTFTVIYKLTEWLEEELAKRKPKVMEEKISGRAKIIRIFSRMKNKQVIGAKVKEGKIDMNGVIKIIRRDFEIGTGKLLELQQQKIKVSEVLEGVEFGAMIEADHEIAEGDYIESVVVVEK